MQKKEWSMDQKLNFMKRVFLIIGIQLALTACIVIAPTVNEKVKIFMKKNFGISIGLMALGCTISCCMTCKKKYSRAAPLKYLLLTIFTLCKAYTVATIASALEPIVVLQAMIMTAGVTLILALYATFTSKDFTTCHGVMVCWGTCMVLYFLIILTWDNKHMGTLFALIGIMFAAILFVIDIQSICGGKRKDILEDDYVLGALLIYMDVITMFSGILKLCSCCKK